MHGAAIVVSRRSSQDGSSGIAANTQAHFRAFREYWVLHEGGPQSWLAKTKTRYVCHSFGFGALARPAEADVRACADPRRPWSQGSVSLDVQDRGDP